MKIWSENNSSHVLHTNQYETFEKLECREYLRISACISQQVNTSSAKISASCQTVEPANNPEYVNLQLTTQ
ncbi:hypothetical protein DPMN_140228 [Dreissena polymorpha]|uniref:Uncharacterized protein n=1 Tax=Dreissena polymorpha TaxID=45954 RepID=A0A9D4GAL0_DREPO|nr:hypothetical protein DPMN_140228 [Dreissena polymorpha]